MRISKRALQFFGQIAASALCNFAHARTQMQSARIRERTDCIKNGYDKANVCIGNRASPFFGQIVENAVSLITTIA